MTSRGKKTMPSRRIAHYSAISLVPKIGPIAQLRNLRRRRITDRTSLYYLRSDGMSRGLIRKRIPHCGLAGGSWLTNAFRFAFADN
jgi:hypothetical protein